MEKGEKKLFVFQILVFCLLILQRRTWTVFLFLGMAGGDSGVCGGTGKKKRQSTQRVKKQKSAEQKKERARDE